MSSVLVSSSITPTFRSRSFLTMCDLTVRANTMIQAWGTSLNVEPLAKLHADDRENIELISMIEKAHGKRGERQQMALLHVNALTQAMEFWDLYAQAAEDLLPLIEKEKAERQKSIGKKVEAAHHNPKTKGQKSGKSKGSSKDHDQFLDADFLDGKEFEQTKSE